MREVEVQEQGAGWRPSPQQVRVLDALVAGKTNAEIGIMLGISPDGAKLVVERLVSASGRADRQDLARWWSRERSRAERPFPPTLPLKRASLALAGGALAVLLVLAAFGVGMEDNDAGNGATVPAAAAVPTPDLPANVLAACPELTPMLGPPGAGAPSPAELAAQGMLRVPDSGIASDCPLIVTNRTDRAFVRMPLSATSTLAGRTYGMHLPFSHYTSFLSIRATRLSLEITRSTAYTGPGVEVIFAARAHDGQRHRAAVASDGSLWVSAEAIPLTTALEYLTGEQLDLNATTRIGRLHERTGDYGLVYVNRCLERPVCEVYIYPSRLIAPLSGFLACDDAGNARLEGPGLSLLLRDARYDHLRGDAVRAGSPCRSRPVAAGEPIEPNVYVAVSAYDADGRQVSVAIAEDGSLHIGTIRPALGCPCINDR
jgi:hypothetical protein